MKKHIVRILQQQMGYFLILLVLLTLFISANEIAVGESISGSDDSPKLVNSLFDMPLSDLLQTEVSLASKLGGQANKSPGNVTVITQDDIIRYGYRTAGEAIERAIGFVDNDITFFSALGGRGFNPQRLTANARILILVDGLRMNTWSNEQAFVDNLLAIDIESIEKIEVLRGAGSSIWGGDAIFGVINIITKDGQSNNNKRILSQYNSNNSDKGYLSWGDQTGGGLKYFGSFSFTGYHSDQTVLFPDQMNVVNDRGTQADGLYKDEHYRTNAKLSYDDFYANIFYHHQQQKLSLGIISPDAEGYAHSPMLQNSRIEFGKNTKVWRAQNGELTTRLYHTDDTFRQVIEAPSSQDQSITSFDGYSEAVRTVGGEIRYSQDILKNLKGLIGAETVRIYGYKGIFSGYMLSPDGEDIPESRYRIPVKQYGSVSSYFFDLNYSPTQQLSFFVGGRSEKVSNDRVGEDKTTDFDPIFSPRAAIVANPDKSTTLKLMYSKGFKTPNAGEAIIYPKSPQPLDAESVDFYEFYSQKQVNDWLVLNGSLFYNDLSKPVLFSFVGDDDEYYYTNFKGFTTKGVELEGRAKHSPMLQSYLSFSKTWTENKEDGNSLTDLPSYLARAGLSWGSKDSFTLSPELMFGGSTTAIGSDPAEHFEFNPYILTNLTLVAYPYGPHHCRISTSIYNLFDDKFVRTVDYVNERPIAAENGRQFRIQLSWEF